MLRSANAGFPTSLQDSFSHRMDTLQEVLTGQMNPLERRLELAGRRQEMFFGGTASSSSNESDESGTEESSSNQESEQESSEFEAHESVEVDIESPSENELRAANFLAEKHPDAETVTLSSSDRIEVSGAPGGTFSLSVTEVLDREFGEVVTSETTASSTPSMSTAAAEKISRQKD